MLDCYNGSIVSLNVASINYKLQATSKFLGKITKRKERRERERKKFTDAVCNKMDRNYISIPWHFHSDITDNEHGGASRIWSCIFLPYLLKRTMELSLKNRICLGKISDKLENWKKKAKFSKATRNLYRRKKRGRFDSIRPGKYWWLPLPQKSFDSTNQEFTTKLEFRSTLDSVP